MNPPENPSPNTKKRLIQLQGPRPTPLKVSPESHKIGKPPIPPRQFLPFHPQVNQRQQPIIIYTNSPKPIKVDPSNFMSIVQQLTGHQPTQNTLEDVSFPFSGDAPVSPAARMAAIERASPTEKDRRRGGDNDDFLMDMLAEDGGQMGVSAFDVGQIPGILSPAPANLPAISPGLFSPITGDGQNVFGSDWLMSPFMSNNFLPSPSAMFFNSTTLISPTVSPGADIFNLFDL